jgi:hypothetical protein
MECILCLFKFVLHETQVQKNHGQKFLLLKVKKSESGAGWGSGKSTNLQHHFS